MKRKLIWGWAFVILAIIMLCFTCYGFYVGNDFGAMMCCVAAGINISNAVMRFTEYKYQREWNESIDRFDEAFRTCWPEENENETKDDNRITD